MTTEEKAKAYDEAIKRASNLHKDAIEMENSIITKTCEIIFPELKESEDDRIRKVLIRFHKSTIDVDGIKGEDIIAWLEKKGEPNWCHHKVDLSNCSEEYRKAYYDGWNNCNMQHFQCKSDENDVVKCLINGMRFYYEDNEEATWGTEKLSMKVKDILSWLEKKGKKKSVDRVEPKSKVGDWVTNGIDFTFQIRSIENNMYLRSDDYFIDIETADKTFRLWTIQDAKDGDVLCSNQIILLFKQWEDDSDCNFVIAHAGIDISGKLQITDGHWLISNESKPATKEQRDLLFQKMKEAGYEWDAEKKELNKIEHNLAWSEEDERKFSDILALLRGGENCHYNTPDLFDFLKSLRDRYTWKPSGEQIKVLEFFIPYVTKCSRVVQESKDTLLSLLSDLKKLI